MANFQKSKNKFKYVYLLTPKGVTEKLLMASRFLKRKVEEHEALKSELPKDIQDDITQESDPNLGPSTP